MSIWYDKQGKVLVDYAWYEHDKKKWEAAMGDVEKLLTDMDYKRVAGTEVKIGRKKYWVSTVWLGLDHSFSWTSDKPNPAPLIFETMIFRMGVKARDNSLDYQTRCSTEEQAKQMHQDAIDWLNDGKAS